MKARRNLNWRSAIVRANLASVDQGTEENADHEQPRSFDESLRFLTTVLHLNPPVRKQEQQAEREKNGAGQQPAEQKQSEPAGEQRKDDEMTRQEAAALLDSQRDQEVQPEDVTKRAQGVVVGEPAQDW